MCNCDNTHFINVYQNCVVIHLCVMKRTFYLVQWNTFLLYTRNVIIYSVNITQNIFSYTLQHTVTQKNSVNDCTLELCWKPLNTRWRLTNFGKIQISQCVQCSVFRTLVRNNSAAVFWITPFPRLTYSHKKYLALLFFLMKTFVCEIC